MQAYRQIYSILDAIKERQILSNSQTIGLHSGIIQETRQILPHDLDIILKRIAESGSIEIVGMDFVEDDLSMYPTSQITEIKVIPDCFDIYTSNIEQKLAKGIDGPAPHFNSKTGDLEYQGKTINFPVGKIHHQILKALFENPPGDRVPASEALGSFIKDEETPRQGDRRLDYARYDINRKCEEELKIAGLCGYKMNHVWLLKELFEDK
jgi:hypothetical protein